LRDEAVIMALTEKEKEGESSNLLLERGNALNLHNTSTQERLLDNKNSQP